MGTRWRLSMPLVAVLGVSLGSWAGCDANRSSNTFSETGPEEIPEPGDITRCEDASLEWRTGNKTHYNSYPEPGSSECIDFNGCAWEGLFAGCSGKRSEEWVSQTNIVAVFPGFEDLVHHEICIRTGSKLMIVNVLDTCADSDCSGCCSANLGSADALIDLESYTNARWGLDDGPLEWADLGPRDEPVCD